MHQYTLNLKEFFLKYPRDSIKLGKILKTEGSTYKKKGAIKLVHSLQNQIGILSGGCHEAFINESILKLDHGEVFEVDTSSDADLYFGSQTGCQGKVLIEVQNLLGTPNWEDFANKHLQTWLNPKIVTIGYGVDTHILSRLFQTLKWPVEFWDFRSNHLQEDTNVSRLVLEKDLATLNMKPQNDALAVLLMSHNYHYDLCGLEFATRNNAKFIGVLGPPSRKSKLISELRQKTDLTINENIIFGPVGIAKLGYDEEAIALSITSQLKKEFFH